MYFFVKHWKNLNIKQWLNNLSCSFNNDYFCTEVHPKLAFLNTLDIDKLVNLCLINQLGQQLSHRIKTAPPYMDIMFVLKIVQTSECGTVWQKKRYRSMCLSYCLQKQSHCHSFLIKNIAICKSFCQLYFLSETQFSFCSKYKGTKLYVKGHPHQEQQL